MFFGKKNKKTKAQIRSEQYAAKTGVYIMNRDPVALGYGERLFVCLAKALAVFCLVFSIIGVFTNTMEMPVNYLLVAAAILFVSLLISVMSFNKILYNTGLIALFFSFLVVIIRGWQIINSGFCAILNICINAIDNEYNLGGLRQYTEMVPDRELTITMCLMTIGAVGALLLCVAVSNTRKTGGMYSLALLMFGYFCVIEEYPAPGWLFFYLFSVIVVTFIMRSIHKKTVYAKDGVTIREAKHRKQDHPETIRYVHETNANGMLRTIGWGAIAALICTVALGSWNNFTLFTKPVQTNVARRALDDFVKTLTVNGIAGFFNDYNQGPGGTGGQLGGVSTVRMDFQPDVRVTFVPFTTERMYLRQKVYDTYDPVQRHWRTTQNADPIDSNSEGYTDAVYRMQKLTEQMYPYTQEKISYPELAYEKMQIELLDYGISELPLPYITDYSSMKPISADNTGRWWVRNELENLTYTRFGDDSATIMYQGWTHREKLLDEYYVSLDPLYNTNGFVNAQSFVDESGQEYFMIDGAGNQVASMQFHKIVNPALTKNWSIDSGNGVMGAALGLSDVDMYYVYNTCLRVPREIDEAMWQFTQEHLDTAKLNSIPVRDASGIVRFINYDKYKSIKKYGFSIDDIYNDEYQEGSIVFDYSDFVNSLIKLFKDEYLYTYSPGKTPNDKEFVTYFLENQKSGYCVYFATAAAMLLRENGIPARYCEGYALDYQEVLEGELVSADEAGWIIGTNPMGKTAVVTTELTDASAHAWVEIYYPGLGWMPVEFTVSDMAEGEYSDFWESFASAINGDNTADIEDFNDRLQNGVSQTVTLLKNIIIIVFSVAAAALVLYLLGRWIYYLYAMYLNPDLGKRLIYSYKILNRKIFGRGIPNAYHKKTAEKLIEAGFEKEQVEAWIGLVEKVSYAPKGGAEIDSEVYKQASEQYRSFIKAIKPAEKKKYRIK